MKNKILQGIANLILPCSLVSGGLIPREMLFQRSSCLSIKISPDSERLAYIGSDKEGTLNLYVNSRLSLEGAQKITHFTEPEIKNFYWLPDNKTILLLKDKDGTGCFHLYSVDLDSLLTEDLTSNYENINCKVFHVSQTETKAIIGINNRNPRFHDLYLLDIESKTISNIYENDQFINFLFDDELNLTLKTRMNQDSSITVMDKDNNIIFSRSAEDAFHTYILKANKEEKCFYLIDNLDTNTTQLKKIYLNESYKEVVLAHNAKSDITEVYFEDNEPLAYSTYFTEKQWHPLSKKLTFDVNYLTSKIGSNFEITDKSYNNEYWILKNSVPDEGTTFWLYDRLSKALSSLHSSTKIQGLAKMYPLVIPSSDGLELVSYLTLPKDMDLGGKTKKPLPLVVIPHGGPFQVRDLYAYNPFHQWLASRGYAVLSVNFRLSSGFGKDFVNAGNGQWGKKAHQDILDAVKWCINAKIAEDGKTAIFGGSYGGYEALAGLTFSPNAFACAIAICAPSHLKNVLDKVPFYWELQDPGSDKVSSYTKNAFIKSMGGDPDEESGALYLESCSPINYVDNIEKPLLLVHGVNDHIVTVAASDQIFEKMKEKKLPIVYLSFPDEGHGVRKFANSMCYLAHSEWFLAQILGGIYEPITEKQLQSSSVTIRSHGIAHQELTKSTNTSAVR